MLASHLHRRLVLAGTHRRRDLRDLVVWAGRAEQRLVERAGAVGGQLVEPPDRGVVGGIEDGLVGVGIHDHVVDQGHPLAPVVEGGELTDDRHHGVGLVTVVGRDVGQVLDLAHDVVAEVAHEAAVEGWELVERR